MEINDSFRVSTPIDDTWKVLLDIERIAPCLPGAQLQEIDGDEFRGVVKVKVGPITAQYKGAATLTEVDEVQHHVAISASGRDTRGQGNASATIRVAMFEDSGGTRVDISTDLTVTGKVAQFARGTLGEVSAKLLRQFVDNLERDVLAGAPTDGRPAPSADATSPSDGATPVVASAVRRVDAPEAAPVDLLGVAGAPLAKRVAPVVAVVVALLLLRWIVRRRGC
jgi:carbon monoxide dehydrogenase subunit G